jgi:ferredoxin
MSDAAGAFTVELARSGRSFVVPADKSILDTLLEAGIEVDRSCEEGLCGSCETRLLAGTPDHRDFVLSAKQRENNSAVILCVSRATSEKLVLDI